MNKSYFAIERNGQCYSPVVFVDDDGELQFNDFLTMSYEEMKSSDALGAFVAACMDAANEASGSEDEQTVVTLVGEDGTFVWGILMGIGNNEVIEYFLIDWKKDDHNYRYED